MTRNEALEKAREARRKAKEFQGEHTLDNYQIPVGSESLNGCSECRRIFKGIRAFDVHRVGQHGLDRKCASLTAQEPNNYGLMLSGGFWCIDPTFEKENKGVL
jgi:hypothetical protein